MSKTCDRCNKIGSGHTFAKEISYSYLPFPGYRNFPSTPIGELCVNCRKELWFMMQKSPLFLISEYYEIKKDVLRKHVQSPEKLINSLCEIVEKQRQNTRAVIQLTDKFMKSTNLDILKGKDTYDDDNYDNERFRHLDLT